MQLKCSIIENSTIHTNNKGLFFSFYLLDFL